MQQRSARNPLPQVVTVGFGVLISLLWLPRSASGQVTVEAANPALIKKVGATQPQSPAVERDGSTKVTVRAVRLEKSLTVDGRLDEHAYETAEPSGDFIQQEPKEGAIATEKTDAWVFFDDRNLYISARCWDSHPEREVVTELRRDQINILYGENFTVVVDTFLDRRNGFFFQTNPLGALRDQSIVDDGQNDSWNPVWDVKTARFDGGWTLEMAIPFKSLRYKGAGPQVWGINMRRVASWKNEPSYLSKVAASYGLPGASRMASAGTLVGLETPAESLNLELKPYAVSSVTTDKAATAPFNNNLKGSAGIDFKYGLTRGLIADATYNTDFAQIEEDVQQVNLTRFSLFFPEKRDFFLEGQSIFFFGGVTFSGNSTPGDVPVLFFSRQIGLSQGQAVPVLAGGRVTGRAGDYTIGALNIQTSDKPEAGAAATNFSVVRLKRNILKRSNIGIIATHRNPTVGNNGSNTALGADANLLLGKVVTINSYYARTETSGIRDGATSYRGVFTYAGDRYGLVAQHVMVGERFNPQIGYVQRTNFRRSTAQARFSPRPKRNELIRKLTYQFITDYVTDASATTVENRKMEGTFLVDFQNSDQLNVDFTGFYERLPTNFRIAPGVTVPNGGYDYHTTTVSYKLGQQRKVSGTVSAATGTLYDGTRNSASYNGRLALTARFTVEPGVSLNWVDLPYGAFRAQLITSRFILAPTARMLLSSLVQYNGSAKTFNSSVRFMWEYVPGSQVFAVYSDGRDTSLPGELRLMNRSFAIKATRFVRF